MIFLNLDVGILGYIVLYSLTLYNVTDSQLRDWKATEKDILTIKKVNILDTSHHTPFLTFGYLNILGAEVS